VPCEAALPGLCQVSKPDSLSPDHTSKYAQGSLLAPHRLVSKPSRCEKLQCAPSISTPSKELRGFCSMSCQRLHMLAWPRT